MEHLHGYLIILAGLNFLCKHQNCCMWIQRNRFDFSFLNPTFILAVYYRKLFKQLHFSELDIHNLIEAKINASCFS